MPKKDYRVKIQPIGEDNKSMEMILGPDLSTSRDL